MAKKTVPAVCSKPREAEHFRVPVIQCGMETFQAASLIITGEITDITE